MAESSRKAEYYGLETLFRELNQKSEQGIHFHKLMAYVSNPRNIKLAYRNIKRNKGSQTPGTDKMIMKEISEMGEESFVKKIQKILEDYTPQTVRRVFIPKKNGKWRPLGIPAIIDRIVQQCLKQVLEPILEAKFYPHSYGFRPERSTHHALARAEALIFHAQLHYTVKVDIQSFFDNVNHTKLIQQLWTLGIRDQKVLSMIQKILKAPIEKEGVPDKGTPQGGIISPLLANVTLNELDWWIASQWEYKKTRHQYSRRDDKIRELKKSSRLKIGYIVRYCDDFKIFTNKRSSAMKWLKAVKQWLKERLRLEVSEEKTRIINLKKQGSDFLGFTLKSRKRQDSKWVANLKTQKANLIKIKDKLKELYKQIRKSPEPNLFRKVYSTIRGYRNYFSIAHRITQEFGHIDWMLYRARSKLAIFYPGKASQTDSFLLAHKGYKYKRLKCYSQEKIFQKANCLQAYIDKELALLSKQNLGKATIEYSDNRLSRYSMQLGRDAITGDFLIAGNVHCHHVIPVSKGGSDQFSNLIIISKETHKVLHSHNSYEVNAFIQKYGTCNKRRRKITRKLNKYRSLANIQQNS